MKNIKKVGKKGQKADMMRSIKRYLDFRENYHKKHLNPGKK